MKLKIKYPSLKQTLVHLQNQAIESIPYCNKLTEGITSPEVLFYYLKSLVTYKNDPRRVELIHTAESFFEDNFHGSPGCGDCDDFTVVALACLHCIGKNPFVVLAGRKKNVPTHIYCGFIGDGIPVYFDLTQELFNSQRDYKYRQILRTAL